MCLACPRYIKIEVMDYYPESRYTTSKSYWPVIGDALKAAAFESVFLLPVRSSATLPLGGEWMLCDGVSSFWKPPFCGDHRRGVDVYFLAGYWNHTNLEMIYVSPPITLDFHCCRALSTMCLQVSYFPLPPTPPQFLNSLQAAGDACKVQKSCTGSITVNMFQFPGPCHHWLPHFLGCTVMGRTAHDVERVSPPLSLYACTHPLHRDSVGSPSHVCNGESCQICGDGLWCLHINI